MLSQIIVQYCLRMICVFPSHSLLEITLNLKFKFFDLHFFLILIFKFNLNLI